MSLHELAFDEVERVAVGPDFGVEVVDSGLGARTAGTEFDVVTDPWRGRERGVSRLRRETSRNKVKLEAGVAAIEARLPK